ncbi:MAG: Yip1 family protein [Oscillospiraceae bacterium]|nr:Yip1 family protein [Oscillospiraceae bacterium]
MMNEEEKVLSIQYKEKIYILFRLLTHPIDALNDVKYEKKGSLTIANIILFLFFLVHMFSSSKTGYLFLSSNEVKVNIISVFLTSVGAVALWNVCNWAVCTLFDGEGSFREIWIMTCYSILPYVILQPMIVLFSNVLSIDETVLYSTLSTLAMAWFLLLAFLSMMVCQQFTVTKTIVLAIVTFLAILAVAFLALMLFSTSQQIIGFVKNIVLELLL